MRVSWLLLLIVHLVFGSAASLVAQSQKAALLEADKVAAELGRDSGLTIALERSLHTHGVLLWPEAPILEGGSQVSTFLTDLPGGPLHLTWQPLELQISRDSTVAAMWGVTALERSRLPKGPTFGRYISTWSREKDRWSMTALVVIGRPLDDKARLLSGVPSRPASPPSNETRPFVSADQAFAHLARDSGAAIAFRTWADDGALTFGGGGLLTRGPDAIGRAVDGPEQWDWHPVIAGGARSGDLGWTVGEAVIASKEGEPSYSKYLTVWVRRKGLTRFVLDGGNARPRSP